ncbi:MAG TPA: hypothetical protein VL595_36450 [Pseudonocardia sp.]|jgi:hypothetical protein|nr:hypothetical protein [Pseudonocardia sp.]
MGVQVVEVLDHQLGHHRRGQRAFAIREQHQLVKSMGGYPNLEYGGLIAGCEPAG